MDSISIIELDTNGDTLLTWSFPSVSDDLAIIFLERCALSGVNSDVPFKFAKYKGTWHYTYRNESDLPSSSLPKVDRFCVCSTSDTFNPEKHFDLLKCMASIYCTSGTPTKVLQAFLAANTKGTFQNWSSADYDDKRAVLQGCSLKEVVALFGQASVLLWCGMILKKRVVVFGERWGRVQRIARALPQLAWHRQDCGILRPLLQLTPMQLKDLKYSGVYVAACTDSSIKAREDLFDLLVDVPARSITVAEAAKSDFALDSIHKGIAKKMFQLAADPESTDQQLIKVIAVQTSEYLAGLKKICNGKKLTQEIVSSKFLQKPRLQTFFFNLGLAEGMT
eukprot:g3826.t1